MIPVERIIKEGKRNTIRQKRIWKMHDKHMAHLDPYENHRSVLGNILMTEENGKVYYSKLYANLGLISEFITEYTRTVSNVEIYFSDWIKEPYKIIVKEECDRSFRYMNKYDKVIVHLGRETIKAIMDKEFKIFDFIIIKDKGKYKYVTLQINHYKRDNPIVIKENKLYTYNDYGRVYLSTNVNILEYNFKHNLRPTNCSMEAVICT